MKDVAVLGCGTLGTRIATLLRDNNVTPHVTNRNADRRATLANDFKHVYADNREAVNRADLTAITVRPQDVPPLLDTIPEQGMLNFTPVEISEYRTIDIACTPPDDAFDILLYNAEDATRAQEERFTTIFEPLTDYFAATDDHTRELRRLSRIHAHMRSLSEQYNDGHGRAFLQYAIQNAFDDELHGDATTTDGLVQHAKQEYDHRIPELETAIDKTLQEVYHDT